MSNLFKRTDFKGTWGLKGPLITLALLLLLAYFFTLISTLWAPYLYPTSYVLVILFLVAFKKTTWEQLGLHCEHWKQNLLLGGVAGGLVIVTVPLMELTIELSGMGQTSLFAGAENRLLEESDGSTTFVVYFGFITGMAMADQLFFTGYLLQAMIRKTKPALAIYLGGLIFALAHFDLQLGMFLLGLITATFYWFTGSLVAPLIFQIACHTAGWVLANYYPKVVTLLGFLF